MKRISYITIATVLLWACLLQAADVAVLRNGFSIRHERREVRGDVLRLYLDAKADGAYVDIPASQIVEIEPAPAETAASGDLQTAQSSVQDSISAASVNTGIDRDLIESVVHNESSFNPRAVSPKGARGLMQLMPQTAAQLGVKDSFDPSANVDGGSRYLRDLLIEYHSDVAKALAAYNAGPQRVARYNGVPPYPETHAYVARVIREFNSKKLAEQKLTRAKSKQAGRTLALETQRSSAPGSGAQLAER